MKGNKEQAPALCGVLWAPRSAGAIRQGAIMAVRVPEAAVWVLWEHPGVNPLTGAPGGETTTGSRLSPMLRPTCLLSPQHKPQ